MRKRLLLVVVLVVGLGTLTGCDLIDQIMDLISGGSGGGGTGTVVSGQMEFHLAATIQNEDGTSDQGVVGTTFWSGAGSYDPSTKTFTATWDGGDFSNTYFEARLNSTEEYIESFYARQTQANVWFAWTQVYEIRGANVLYSHTENGSRYFVVDGSDAHVIIDLLDYKTWSTQVGGPTDPVHWVTGPGALTGETGDIISIRLDS